MAPLPEKAVNRSVHPHVRRWLSALVGGTLVAAFAGGCSTLTTKEFFSSGVTVVPQSEVCQVEATWQPRVITTTDSAHSGAPLRGIAGRLYLFGPEVGYPLVGEGSLVVDLYDESQPRQAGMPVVPLDEWRIDKDTLKRLRKKDIIGEGYTVFLPLANYKPEITRVQLKARYEPIKGSPLYASSAPFTLNIDESANKAGTVLPASHKTSQPASGR